MDHNEKQCKAMGKVIDAAHIASETDLSNSKRTDIQSKFAQSLAVKSAEKVIAADLKPKVKEAKDAKTLSALCDKCNVYLHEQPELLQYVNFKWLFALYKDMKCFKTMKELQSNIFNILKEPHDYAEELQDLLNRVEEELRRLPPPRKRLKTRS